MTVSPDARNPSATVHALSGSTPPGAGPVVQPFGITATPAANAADTFVPLGGAALDVVAGLAARRAAPLDAADARLIELADAAEVLERACDAHTAAHRGENTDENDAAFGALASGFSPIEEEIAATPATTMLGVMAKARAAQVPTARCFDDCPFALSIADDLWRLSGKGSTLPAAPALSDVGGDAELFAALAQLDRARAVQAAAKRAFDVAEEAMEPAWRAIPDVLLVRDGDPTSWSSSQTIPGDHGYPRHQYAPADVPGLERCSVQGKAQMRLREILEAIKTWQETLTAEEERTGYEAAGERCDEAADVLIDAEKRVHDTPARTLAGLMAKAAVEVVVAERADLDEVTLGFLREVAAFGAGRAAAQHGERGMIGAGLLSLWRRPAVERPVTPPSQPPSAERLCDLSRTELRGALACYDVVDEAVHADGHVLTASEASALAFAEWSLARAARRHVEAYERMADADGT